jgi:serine/threonine protein phosphatase 1
LPDAHRAFLDGLPSNVVVGDYIFVHAGLRPGVPIDQQREQDLLWIRDVFLNDRRRFSKVVVHGHSAQVEVHFDDRRIGIDTGAYATHVLTALCLKGTTKRLIQTRRDGRGPSILAPPV